MSKFARDTSVSEIEPGVFQGHVSRDWWIVFGPNGGFIAAMVVKAMAAAVDDHARAARSLTIHYTAAPIARTSIAARKPPFGPNTIHQSRLTCPSKTPASTSVICVSRSNLELTVRAP